MSERRLASFGKRFASRIVDHVGHNPKVIKNLQWMRSPALASLCSGSEGLGLWLTATLVELMVFMKIGSPPEWKYSCDNDPLKQRWIKENSLATVLVSEMQQLDNPNGVKNLISGDVIQLPENIDGLVCGFSCKTVSLRNPKRQRKCIQNAQGDTGVSFLMLCEHIYRKRPRFLLLENVRGIMTKNTTKAGRSEEEEERMEKEEEMDQNDDEDNYENAFGETQADVVKATLEGFGYTVRVILSNAADFGIPQCRPRVFFVGVRGADVNDAMLGDIEATVEFLKLPSLPMEEFWTDDPDPTPTKPRTYTAMRLSKNAEEPKWLKIHPAVYAAHNVAFRLPDEGDDRKFGKAFSALPAREKSIVLLDYELDEQVNSVVCKQGKDSKEMIRDLTQSVKRSRLMSDMMPCITTGFKGWRKNARRLVSGRECMNFQGLFPELFPAFDQFTRRQLIAIGGDAFCMPQALALLLAILLHVPMSDGRDQDEVDHQDGQQSMSPTSSLPEEASSAASLPPPIQVLSDLLSMGGD